LGQKIEEHDSTKEQKLGSTIESFKTHNPIGLPSFERILVAYDGMQMSKRALSYAAYISKISDSEVVVVNVVESHRDLNNVLPITIKANLEGKAEQTDIARDYRRVPLDEVLREVIEEMTTVCKAAYFPLYSRWFIVIYMRKYTPNRSRSITLSGW
jgi:hypothetical protein